MNDQYLFPISSELDEYNSIRLKYKNLAYIAHNRWLNNFNSIFVNSDGLHEKGNDIAIEYIKNIINVAVDDLIQHKINDIDEGFFFENFLNKYITWDDDFSVVDGKYLEIVSTAEELDQYRTARREGRGRVIGGGFGLSGFAKGAATAGVMNLGTSLIHGTWNLGAKVFSTIGDAMKKQSLFDDMVNRQLLAKSIERMVFCTHYAIIDAIKSKKSKAFSGRITVANEEKSSRLFQNVSKERIKKEEVEDILLESLNNNPYNEEPYSALLQIMGDATGAIERTATYFGVSGVEKEKKAALDAYKSTLDTSNAPACYESLKLLRNKSLQMGYQKFETYEKEVVALAQSLDLQQRTVEGKVFSTTEGAQKERNKLKKDEVFSNNTLIASATDLLKIVAGLFTFLIALAILAGAKSYNFPLFAVVCAVGVHLLKQIRSARAILWSVYIGEAFVSIGVGVLFFACCNALIDSGKGIGDLYSAVGAAMVLASVGFLIVWSMIAEYKKMEYGLIKINSKRIAIIAAPIVLVISALFFLSLTTRDKKTPVEIPAPAVKSVGREEAAILAKVERIKLDASSVVAPYSQDIPFIGKRSYNIDGGSGTGHTIVIAANGSVKIELHGTQSSSVIYEGNYKNPLPVYTDSALVFKGNKVYRTSPDGKVTMTCGYMGHIDTPCVADLYEN